MFKEIFMLQIRSFPTAFEKVICLIWSAGAIKYSFLDISLGFEILVNNKEENNKRELEGRLLKILISNDVKS